MTRRSKWRMENRDWVRVWRHGGYGYWFCFVLVSFKMRDNLPGVGGSDSPYPILHDGAMKGNQVIFNLLHGYPPLSSSGLLSYRLSS